ncbi:MAG: hypothetical protein E7488_05825 [Ruminococcaceae bacterium]|nr:hypothetical protein [Oscillospiraceae bacterium]
MSSTLLSTKNNCFTEGELLQLLCRFSETDWGAEHTPTAMKVYTRSGTYTFEADNPVYRYREE